MHKTPKLNNLPRYSTNYSASGLWDKLHVVARHLGGKITWYVLILYYVLQSPGVSFKDKAIITGALGYLILPVDLIPDFLPVLGITDDTAAIVMAYHAVASNVTPEIERKASDKLRQWFG